VKRHEQTAGLGNLDDLIADAQARTQRPRVVPREALGQLMQNAFGGIGLGAAVGALMFYVGAAYPLETGAVVAVAAGGTVMFVRSFADEALDIRKLRAIQATAKRAIEDSRKRLIVACDELDALEDELAERDATIARLLRDHELTQLELARLKEQLQPKSWTPAADPDAGVKADAMEILTHYFQSGGTWYSRDKAKGAGWSAARHANAQKMLVQAGVMWINVKQPQMIAKSLIEATDMLLTYIRKMAAAGVTPRQEDTDDDNE